MTELTIGENFKMLFGKKKMTQLHFLFTWALGGGYQSDWVTGYKMGDYYIVPKYHLKFPLPPNEAIRPTMDGNAMVEILVPDRDIFLYVVPENDKLEDEMDKSKELHRLVFVNPPKVTEALKKTVSRESNFRLLHVQATRELEIERQNLEPLLKKMVLLGLFIIAIVVFVIVLSVSANSITQVTDKAIKISETLIKASILQAVNNTSAMQPITW